MYLIRHARAGQRSRWVGDDAERPLDDRGHVQAAAIADHLAPRGITALWSSPYRRCVQTLEPLGERLGLEVGTCSTLAEGAEMHHALDLVRRVAAGTAMCTHGDLLPEIVAGLERRGARVLDAPDWRKGVTWSIERAPEPAPMVAGDLDDDLSAWTLRVWGPPPS